MSKDKLDYFILENIYLDLCRKVIQNNNLEYNSNYIYLSTIPDFIENNEKYFNNHQSQDYKTFIKEKINHYIKNKNLYTHKPAIIILLKIINIFDEEQEDDELIILYNRLLNMINYMHPEYLFINEDYVSNNKTFELVTNRNVKQSSIIQVYNNLPLLEDFHKFVKKIFQQNKKNYDLLLSEFNMLNTYDLSHQKFNNLKFNIFLSSLEQFLIIKPEPLDLTYFFDLNNLPDAKSIKFSVFMAWYIYNKVVNDKKIKINVINDYSLNIDKFYNYLIVLNNKQLKIIIDHVLKPEVNILNKNKYDIDELFNENNQFILNDNDLTISYINQFNDENIQVKNNQIHNNTKNITNTQIMREQLVYSGGGIDSLSINPIGKIILYLQ